MFPNPVSSVLNVNLNGLETATVVIRDVLGKIVYTTKTTESNLKLQTQGLLNTGLYFVIVTDENNKAYFNKLIVK